MTAQTLAVDYSFARPSLADIKAAGYVAVGRYLGADTSKCISRDEARRIHRKGLGIFLVFENAANRALGGKTAGVVDAHAAVNQANAVGLPKNCPIFFAVDFDTTAAQVRPYFEGVFSVLGDRSGVYGGIKVTEGLRDMIAYRWQTAAWSAGQVDPNAHLYQRLKMTHPIPQCDENVICHPFPLWVRRQGRLRRAVALTRGKAVEKARAVLATAKGRGRRAKLIAAAQAALDKIRPFPKKKH
ncbi:MAG TPA: DUF1906 domain-containing protein [Acidimicrobiales bacterium]|nr:DUF1906 domain-containing protein [Acidimicrobiales bacterium]